MTIKAVCPSCKKTINAPEKYAGRKVNCPGCKAKLTIPDPAEEQDLEAPEEEEVKPKKAKKSSGKKAKPGASSKSKKVGSKKISGRSKASGERKGKGEGKKRSGRRERASKEEKGKKIGLPVILGGVAGLLIVAGAIIYFVFPSWLGLGEDPKPPRKPNPLVADNNQKDDVNTDNDVAENEEKADSTNNENGRSKNTPSSPESDRSLASYIPAKTGGFGGFNLVKLLNIPQIKKEIDANQDFSKFETQFNETPEAKKFLGGLKDAGVIAFLEKTFKSISFIVDTNNMEKEKAPEFMALIETHVDAAEFLHMLNTGSKEKAEFKALDSGLEAYALPKSQFFLGAIHSKLILNGTEKMLNQAYELHQNEEKKNDKFASLKTSNGDQILWFSWESNGEVLAEPNPLMPVDPKEIEGATLGLDYNETDGIILSVTVNIAKEESASQAAEGIKAMAGGMAQGFGISDKELSIAAEGKDIKMKLNLNQEKMDMLAGMFKAQLQQAIKAGNGAGGPGIAPPPQ